QPELGRHFRVLTTFRTGQNDPGSQSQRLRRLPRIVSDVSSARSSSLNIRGASCWTAIGDSVAVCPILGTATRIYCESMIANL
ncbi:hypothetical protein, partial [Bradyrhizobium iriomotense]|uniref:hypothetical protein n=1 Tax=Bradyrhizobium iriomotense TaxID=441950 RepID=UPI0024E07328